MNTATAEKQNKIMYISQAENFSKIPGSPIAYWVSQQIISDFAKGELIEKVCEPKQGLITGDNDRFLRLWYETNITKISFTGYNDRKWFPINKGGEYRKWYGNREYIVNWFNNGYEIQNFKDSKGKLRSRPQNLNYNFQNAISWSLITTGKFSVRYYDDSFTFNVAGISCFPPDKHFLFVLAFLNSEVAEKLTKILNPTLNMNVGDISRIPIIIRDEEKILAGASECVKSSKSDWDSFETSWDFKKHPLI